MCGSDVEALVVDAHEALGIPADKRGNFVLHRKLITRPRISHQVSSRAALLLDFEGRVLDLGPLANTVLIETIKACQKSNLSGSLLANELRIRLLSFFGNRLVGLGYIFFG